MAENKTRMTDSSVEEFLQSVSDEQKRRDSKTLVKLMREVTGEPPKMWGTSMVGFGSYHYKYDSGREGDYFLTGFAPRKQALTLYIMSGFTGHDELMEKLGKHSTGKSCLYVKTLADVDQGVLRKLVERSVAHVKKRYPSKTK